jgi:serine/threonine-protein kinase RsbW
LALEESLFNAARHGNKLDPEKTVTVDFLINSEKIDLTVTDQGDGFDPEELPDPRKHENLYKYGGRGVLLMRSYMDVVEFNEKGNQVHMVKYRRH